MVFKKQSGPPYRRVTPQTRPSAQALLPFGILGQVKPIPKGIPLGLGPDDFLFQPLGFPVAGAEPDYHGDTFKESRDT